MLILYLGVPLNLAAFLQDRMIPDHTAVAEIAGQSKILSFLCKFSGEK